MKLILFGIFCLLLASIPVAKSWANMMLITVGVIIANIGAFQKEGK